MRWSELEGRRVLILGTGREGTALAEHLPPGVAGALAADDRDGDAAAAWRARFGEDVPLLIAPGADELRGRADVAIASPGIPPHAPLRRAVAELGIPETSATDLWLGEHAGITTAVTGSKGKSTTASLVHALSLAHGVDAALGGNIGIPLLSLPPAARYVAELSSYQSSSVTTSPDVVVLTALFPEHLDWHGSEEDYYAAKLNLAAHGARRVIANGEDARLAAALERLAPGLEVERVGPPGERWALGEAGGALAILRDGELVTTSDGIALQGRHNLRNAALALAALEAAGTVLDRERVAAALAAFEPLEHRLERIEDPSGVVFVNDTLSTSPYAAVVALEAFDRDDVVLIVGGQDRGVDYAPLAERLAGRPVAAVVGLPESGPRILRELAGTGVLTVPVDDMDAAVATARRLVPPGGIVLLSPAAPSYGRYRDFAERADDFRRAIAATAP